MRSRHGNFLVAAAVVGVLALVVAPVTPLSARADVAPEPVSAARPAAAPVANASSGDLATPSLPTAPVKPAVADTALEGRVAAIAHGLVASGIPIDQVRLPYLGAAAEVSNGVVVPGPMLEPSSDAYPTGVAYYGESEANGSIQATVLNASSVVGSLRVNQLDALYLDSENPDMWGTQLNAHVTGVNLEGRSGYTFWAQNAIDYETRTQTLALGDDVWNFSTGSASIPGDASTIESHSPNASIVQGIYVGFGPTLIAPTPFALTLYLNSSVTREGDQELWFNYSLSASGEPARSGNYDWLVFHSVTAQDPGPAARASFEANGFAPDALGIPEDFELDLGIGGYNGASLDVLAANLSAQLAYCPIAVALCSPSDFRSVPSAENFGADSGETGVGLSITYSGTTAYGSAGPAIPNALWGLGNASGSAAGAGRVTNAITVSGSPVPLSQMPYAFVFIQGLARPDEGYAWAPDVPQWDLMPGNYSYEVMLADYAEETGSFQVSLNPNGSTLAAILRYSPSSGVYTPLWAFSNGELAGISISGDGSASDQYVLFDNPTNGCDACGGALNGSLSSAFFSLNDYLYPDFFGILLDGTTSFVLVAHPPSLEVYTEAYGGPGPLLQTFSLYLQIGFYETERVTLANATAIRGWAQMTEIMMAAFAPPAQNPFPLADVEVWYSTSDLILSDRFVAVEPLPTGLYSGIPPSYTCPANLCASPDQLLLYGGSNNTVWGSTMVDPPGQPLGGGVYAGLAEAESGDWVYNNNFSIDNPVMRMAYDIYNDSCPVSFAGSCTPLSLPVYHDTWNVSNQSATNAARTVNGYPLEGNVLGPTYQLQGGNYWWDWGNSLNPFSTLPFVNRFNYSQYQTIFPPGYGQFVASIPVGGDLVPLRLGYEEGLPAGEFAVAFRETGLSPSAPWSVTLDAVPHSSSASQIVVELPNGTYPFSVAPVGRQQPTPSSGDITVQGQSVTENISYAPYAYPVIFTNTGLPIGTTWEVDLAGTAQASQGGNVTFTEPNGTYAFSVLGPSGEAADPSEGNVSVLGAPASVTVAFHRVAYAGTFVESGLPNGTTWNVTILSNSPGSANDTIALQLPNGSYSFVVGTIPGYTASPASGTLTIRGGPATQFVNFTRTGGGGGPLGRFLGLPGGRTVLLVGGLIVVGVVVAALAVYLIRRNRPKA